MILRDSDFFRDNEDTIKLESCPSGVIVCNSQMLFMNGNLLLARKLVENKEYPRALQVIKQAYDSTFDLKDEGCQKCSNLFRDIILGSLNQIVNDLRKLTKGIFGNKNYKYDLYVAEKLLEEIKL